VSDPVSEPAPLRLGVIGLGRAFTLMLPTFGADPRVRLVAACDPRAAAREQFTRDFAAPAYDSVEALVRDASVEAVYVASPHQFHAAQTAIAAAHGKHVLVEKPMALSLAECDAMIDCCARAGVHLLIGHCHSFDSPYLQARALVRSGQFGAVRMVQALNYTDFLYRPRRPEELDTREGGGVVFSQAAHQVDVVRLLVDDAVTRVRAVTGRWDPARPTEGAYSVMLWFRGGAFATLTYSGYGHFDSDEWMGWTGEMGHAKSPQQHGAARRRLQQLATPADEARLKNEATYGGPHYQPPPPATAAWHQHFGPMVVSCDHADLRPMADGTWVYGNEHRQHYPLAQPQVPRFEVIDELYAALRQGTPPLHDGPWARATLQACLAILESARLGRDVELGG
jgi:phthalate 4,5-cis-dihydrodiol dehydrogenase